MHAGESHLQSSNRETTEGREFAPFSQKESQKAYRSWFVPETDISPGIERLCFRYGETTYTLTVGEKHGLLSRPPYFNHSIDGCEEAWVQFNA